MTTQQAAPTSPNFISLIKATYKGWSEAKANRLAAALAYYAIFSLSPLLIVLIAIAGIIYGEAAVEGRVAGEIEGVTGQEGAEFIQSLIAANRDETTGIIATIIGALTLVLGASAAFGHLKDALNTLWGTTTQPAGGIKTFIRSKLISFALVLFTGFLLLASLLSGTLLTTFGRFLFVQSSAAQWIFMILDIVISFMMITVLFALIFKILPDQPVEVKPAFTGAAFTALLFILGKYILSIYLANASSSSVFGAAGSLIVILLWIYYSAQIFFFGAKFTHLLSVSAKDAVT
jgi:membrane protein